jgi:cyclophilin family peptidyl-prolyl cis-trans isomerase
MKKTIALLLPGLLALACNSQPDASAFINPAADRHAAAAIEDTVQLPATNFYEISTPLGAMVIRLHDETPVHRDNFKKLVEQGFYDGTTFHRVITHFMIQGGDPNSRDDDPYNDGAGDPGYTLPAEFVPELFHRRGAIAAARQGDHVNPERRSSGSQFYIVQGSPMDSTTLAMVEQEIRRATEDPGFRFSDDARSVYQTEGGAPNLDAQYSVFAQLIEGFDVLDRIAEAETPRRARQPAPPPLLDRPIESVPMTVRPLPDYEPTRAHE